MIMAVALIAIGPKDLPIAIRTVTGLMKKARGMASEFQGHVDEMMREANLSDVKTEINKLRRFDFKGAAERTIDPDGTLRDAVQTDVFDKPTVIERTIIRQPGHAAPLDEAEVAVAAPAFIPPDHAAKQPVPDFIPPGTRRWGY